MREALKAVEHHGMALSRVGRITDFADSNAASEEIRPVAVEDLLGRAQTAVDRDSIARMVAGRRILVTGSGGTIGGELVRQIARDEEIDIQAQGEGEYIVAESPAHYKHLEQENAVEQAVLGLDSRMVTQEAFREAGYDAPHQHGALMMRPSFGLHPLRYIHGLAEAAERRGAKLHPHSEVTEWQKNDGRHVLRTNGGTLTAKHVIVACNGFMPEGLHKGFAGRALPLQSLIVVTRPLTGDERAAHGWKTECPAINSPNVYHYYRMLPDHRLLIGGRADCAGTPAGADRAAEGIGETIGRMWPHWRGVEIDYQWRGLVCFSSALRPSIGRLPDDPSVYFGFGYHGNGVNTATWTGRELAHWLAGSNSGATSPDHLPALVRGMTPRFPFPSLRRNYARAGTAYYRLKDRFS